MLTHYKTWKGYSVDPLFDLELSVSDPQIQMLLGDKIVWHQKDGIPVFEVKGVNTENGLWSLWRISLSDGDENQRMISLFINDNNVYRPAASKLLWDEMLHNKITLNMLGSESLDHDTYCAILSRAAELTEDTFLEMKNHYYSWREQEYKKRRYALTLRIEAAEKIGIENIKKSRLKELGREKEEMALKFERDKIICPVFKPIFLCRLE
jgi:hypothetical protein